MSKDNVELWENRELGASEEHVKVVNTSADLDDRLGLQAISIRLPKQLLISLKAIANHHQIGYQPMVRDLLNRFADAEMKKILIEKLNDLDKEQYKYKENTTPVSEFIEDLRKQA